MSRRRTGPARDPLPPQPMPAPIDDPPDAAAFAPLWERFVTTMTAWSSHASALERFRSWWGSPLASDLVQWLGATGDGIRPLTRVPEDADSFAWLRQSRELLDYHIYFGGLLPLRGPDVQDTIFYAVLEPPRPTTRVVRWDQGFDLGGTVAIDLPSFAEISDICPREFPAEDDDELREAATRLTGVIGRVVHTFPWARWFSEMHKRLDPDTSAFGTCDVRELFPAAQHHLQRAQPIVDALLDGRAFVGPAVDHTQLDAELEGHADFADFPPRALYWMWLAALNDDQLALARISQAVAGSASKLVRDALIHAQAHRR